MYLATGHCLRRSGTACVIRATRFFSYNTMDLYPAYGDKTDLPDKNDWRLAEIGRLQNRLEEESRIREGIYKKYKRACNTADWVDYTTSALSVGLGATSIGLVFSVIGVPIAPFTTGASAVCALVGTVSKAIAKKLRTKKQKHDSIRRLAISTRDSISILTSKALSDGQITQKEYTAIVREMEQYNSMTQKKSVDETSRKE